ncbi:hypothetical protein SBA4_3020024 [Candidatus Sulfopaludibacter sp. SbA4]|nr:hypothetical protein SBA4_3020024 [Candidatus Sulfopaludibacter sp. SbA4]
MARFGVLPKLYGRILVPPAVCAELKRLHAPDAVRLWIAKPPAWLETRAPGQAPDAELLKARLDAGERDAILLAQELGADNLIIDERRGRREAERRHPISRARSAFCERRQRKVCSISRAPSTACASRTSISHGTF